MTRREEHDALFDKWVEWLDRIESDITLLHADRQIWREIRSMLDANDAIPEREFIRNWITQ